MDVLGSEGAPPRLEGADPGLHARDVDGRGRVGEVRVVGLLCLGDRLLNFDPLGSIVCS